MYFHKFHSYNGKVSILKSFVLYQTDHSNMDNFHLPTILLNHRSNNLLMKLYKLCKYNHMHHIEELQDQRSHPSKCSWNYFREILKLYYHIKYKLLHQTSTPYRYNHIPGRTKKSCFRQTLKDKHHSTWLEHANSMLNLGIVFLTSEHYWTLHSCRMMLS